MVHQFLCPCAPHSVSCNITDFSSVMCTMSHHAYESLRVRYAATESGDMFEPKRYSFRAHVVQQLPSRAFLYGVLMALHSFLLSKWIRSTINMIAARPVRSISLMHDPMARSLDAVNRTCLAPHKVSSKKRTDSPFAAEEEGWQRPRLRHSAKD